MDYKAINLCFHIIIKLKLWIISDEDINDALKWTVLM